MKIQTISTINQNNYKNNRVNKQNPTFGRDWSEHISWGANYIKEKGTANFKLFSFPDAKAVFVEVAKKVEQGFGLIRDRVVKIAGTAGAGLVITDVLPNDDNSRIYPMAHNGDGVYVVDGVESSPDDNYRYIIVDGANNVNIVKDPYTKKQEDINGWSSIYASDNYEWQNNDWIEGCDARRIVRKPHEPLRGLENLVIEEVNIPTLSEEGTFEGAKVHIDEIADRGVANAIEIMPVENTYSMQWGYDGVDKFAVNEKLGGAVGLKSLIDYAHGKGINVIIDVVPNHMGPDGDYLPQTGPYENGPGEFGSTLNYEGSHNRYVRDWMANAALWWASEFKVDGIRFDMTKETASDFLLKQIVEELNEHFPKVFTIAEDGRENKISVTRYNDEGTDSTHADRLDFIDTSIDLIHSRGWKTTPQDIGFDSEWDFPLMHAVKDAVTHTNQTSLGEIDKYIETSAHRIKYAMSHDEIGNNDGTRLIPKVMAQYLDYFSNIEGANDAIRGQRAARMSQRLLEIIITRPEISNAELTRIQREFGSSKFYDKKTITTALKTALAKQRLAQGTIMTIPGPKMFFQGDDSAEIAPFKFFREFSGERLHRAFNADVSRNVIAQKGYDTFVDEARPDCVIGTKGEPKGEFKDVQTQMLSYNKDLRTIINRNPALQRGTISARFKDYDKLVHIHRLTYEDNDIVVFKNFADTFYDGNFSTLGFPKDGEWIEIFNSDDKKYGGSGMTNGQTIFTDLGQNLKFAANSIIILKRISK